MTARAAHSDTGTLKATQLQLVDVPAVPSLSPRQQRAFEIVAAAGSAGIHADELGAALHAEYKKHSLEHRCMFCGRTGQSILNALKAKSLVKYTRGTSQVPGFWRATGAQQTEPSQLEGGWDDLLKAGF